MKNIFNKIREEISSIWTLLNDTEIFLIRIKRIEEYEKDIREWRNVIKQYYNNNKKIILIKQEIINLRKSLRLQGYDLKLGSKDIQASGFKNDESPIEGYRRMVIVINKENIYYITGDENHQELMRYLCLRNNIDNISVLGEVHSLWFRWKANILQISGADSETKDDFEKFKNYLENNKSLMLKKLKNIF